MRLLQFSTSHYCRKVRLALGLKGLAYGVENLTPGLHRLRLGPLTGGLTTVPVLLPERDGEPIAIADSSRIVAYLDRLQPEPRLVPIEGARSREALQIEDWLDESIGTAVRFVYYDYRAGAGRDLDPSLASQVVIQIVRRQYGIRGAAVDLARDRLDLALAWLKPRWENASQWLTAGPDPTIADLTAAALLSPLARLPEYHDAHPWLFERIAEIHQRCREPLPPGL